MKNFRAIAENFVRVFWDPIGPQSVLYPLHRFALVRMVQYSSVVVTFLRVFLFNACALRVFILLFLTLLIRLLVSLRRAPVLFSHQLYEPTVSLRQQIDRERRCKCSFAPIACVFSNMPLIRVVRVFSIWINVFDFVPVIFAGRKCSVSAPRRCKFVTRKKWARVLGLFSVDFVFQRYSKSAAFYP